ncbi:MAG: flagellar assembly peptidoglycan hydrolase FlgJ [Pseudomonadota bacterium]|jgi:flagellar protein FlgJ
MTVPSVPGQLAIDATGLEAVKRQAREDPRAALKSAAQQFEAVFLQMVLKAMREATPQSGLTDGEQGRFYMQMLDQQLAQTLAARGATGLAALMERQLARGLPEKAGGAIAGIPEFPPMPQVPAQTRPLSPTAVGEKENGAPPHVREFIDRLWPHALEASRATGIPPHFMIAHAALETGWGRHEPRLADGRPSHNLFGIKAGRGWSGATVEAATTEFENGRAVSRTERFRAYASYGEAFHDYARLLTGSPRYAEVLGSQDPAAFARGLARAGYASDPMYADKLTRVIGSDALRMGLAG